LGDAVRVRLDEVRLLDVHRVVRRRVAGLVRRVQVRQVDAGRLGGQVVALDVDAPLLLHHRLEAADDGVVGGVGPVGDVDLALLLEGGGDLVLGHLLAEDRDLELLAGACARGGRRAGGRGGPPRSGGGRGGDGGAGGRTRGGGRRGAARAGCEQPARGRQRQPEPDGANHEGAPTQSALFQRGP